jgi:hypothetical protein
MNTKKVAAIHPIMAWFESSITSKQDVINAGSIAAFLLGKKCEKVAPVSLITEFRPPRCLQGLGQ